MRASPIRRTYAAKSNNQRTDPFSNFLRYMQRTGWSYLYVIPMLIMVAVFVIYPTFASFGYTLYNWNGFGDPSTYVGLRNFTRVIHDPFFWHSFQHTLLYVVILVPVQLTLALVLALILNNPKLRFSTFYRSVYFIPVITSQAVIGIVMQLLLSSFGTNVGSALHSLHLLNDTNISWLGDPHIAFYVIIAIGIWNTLGYNMIYFLAGLQTIPVELYDAAKVDGANTVAQFYYVTVPNLRGTGLVILLLATLGSFQVFDLVLVLTNGGPYVATEVVNTYIYHQSFDSSVPNIGYATAASFFYGAILLLLGVVQALVIRFVAQRRSATV